MSGSIFHFDEKTRRLKCPGKCLTLVNDSDYTDADLSQTRDCQKATRFTYCNRKLKDKVTFDFSGFDFRGHHAEGI